MESEPRTLFDQVSALDRHGDRSAVISLGKEDVQQTSYKELHDLSGRLAGGLQQRGIERGDRLALLGPSSPAWVAACLGIIRAGAIPVPLDVQFDDDALVHVLDDCQPRWVFAGPKQAARLDELQLAQTPDVFLLDDPADGPSWRSLLADAPADLPRPTADQDAVLFYTSGTTGPPKGVPLTHRNIGFQVEVLIAADLVSDNDRVLLPLPLHHVYPLVVGLFTPLARGLPIVLPYSLTGPQMVRALNEADVSIVIGVPRLYRALYDGIRDKADTTGRIGRAGFRLAMGFSSWLRRRLGVRFGRVLLRPLHRRFGDSLRVLACGGSPLDDELAWKLESLGWQVAIGYGLTETSPLLTLNPPGKAKLGTVGRAIPDVELRIERSDEVDPTEGDGQDGQTVGEILARGPSVFHGYHGLPEKTEQVLTDDNWFHTGDLGFVDEEGYLHVTGRKGTMIVTEGGENVQPDQVESAYAEHAAIREIGVLDDDEGRLVALIVPETAEIERGDLEDAIQQAVQTQGKNLPSYQRLADFQLTREALPRTRLGKIQRHKLRERFNEASRGDGEQSAEPISVEEMGSDDRALLDDPAAKQTWDLLAEKYSERRLTPDTSMRLDLGIDSLEWMNLSLAIRRQAGVELDEEAIGRIETVRDLLEETNAASGKRPAEGSPLDDPQATLSEDQKRYLKPLGLLGALMSRAVFAVNRLLMRAVFRLEIEGADRIPDAPIVITPNHTSYLDAPAIAAALPSARLRATYWGGWTGTMFANPIMRWFSRLTRVVPIDPQQGVMSSLAFGAAVLDRQDSLVWFPEGERSPDGELQPFRPGIGLLLEDRQTLIVPTAIQGAHEALPMGRWLPRPRKIRITFGEPLEVEGPLAGGGDEASHERIVKAIQERVEALLNPRKATSGRSS